MFKTRTVVSKRMRDLRKRGSKAEVEVVIGGETGTMIRMNNVVKFNDILDNIREVLPGMVYKTNMYGHMFVNKESMTVSIEEIPVPNCPYEVEC